MNRYPTRNGIAIPPTELDLPDSRWAFDRGKFKNNHHSHFTSRMFGRSALLMAVRDLERHQHDMMVDVHEWLHDNYAPPKPPTDIQAALEVIDAFENGENFKIYNNYRREYYTEPIPEGYASSLIRDYRLGAYLISLPYLQDAPQPQP